MTGELEFDRPLGRESRATSGAQSMLRSGGTADAPSGPRVSSSSASPTASEPVHSSQAWPGRSKAKVSGDPSKINRVRLWIRLLFVGRKSSSPKCQWT